MSKTTACDICGKTFHQYVEEGKMVHFTTSNAKGCSEHLERKIISTFARSA